MPVLHIGAVIVAAGSGTRMGGVAKALLRRGDRTFLETIVRTLSETQPFNSIPDTPRTTNPNEIADPEKGFKAFSAQLAQERAASPFLHDAAQTCVVVVGPPFGDAVAAHARELGARVAVNSDPSRGMSSSINLGFAAFAAGSSDIDAAWLWPVDHPDVELTTLRVLIDKLGDHEVARPVCDGRGGHPPLVRRALFAPLSTCANARDVIAAADVVNVPVDDKGTIEDVDH
jgi:CTP:molybdopterin cytidylyltransferase MocA